jgi:alpha-galactosidase
MRISFGRAPSRTALPISFPLAVILLLLVAHGSAAPPQSAAEKPVLAATPPMGWNSWDSYSRTSHEDNIKANAKWLAKHLKSFGWEYVVVDEGWYLSGLGADGNDDHPIFELDSYGRYVPVLARFPSAGKDRTFKPLADEIHSLGLKFGIHIIRGIPKQAVEKNLPIAGSRFHAADAADTSDVCPWNVYNYGLDPAKPAAQAYYDSLAQLYAAWGVDFIKIDCISDHPYRGEEIRMISEAIAKSARPMVLSLSPGPTSIDKRAEVSEYAQMWRISDDVWDVWNSDKNFPTGVKNQFAYAARWAGVARPGHWPDADMLPIGSLRPAAGWGEPRETRLTHDEQHTLLTLWSIFRSPLIMGGNLLHSDAWTTSVLTNREVLAVDQHSTGNHPVITSDHIIVWLSRPESGGDSYLAVFNVSESRQTIRYDWKDLGLAAGRYNLRDLWRHKNLHATASLDVTLEPHASALFRASPATH